MMKKRYLIGVCIGLIGMVLVASVSPFNHSRHRESIQPAVASDPVEVDPQIPQQIYPCLQLEAVKRIDLLGKTASVGNQFYLVQINTEQTSDDFEGSVIPNSWELLIKRDSAGQCESLHPGDEVGPLSLYVPQAVALELAKQSLAKEVAAAGGKTAFQQSVQEEAKSREAEFYLTPEQIWAFKELGIQLPSKYQILNEKFNIYDGPPTSGE